MILSFSGHEKMKSFFRDCCNVPEPEEEFAIDQYTEATLIAKPVIYITLAEICDTHQLLLDYRFQITDELGENDPLHELLDDLGSEGPSLCSLLGAADAGASKDGSLAYLGQTEVKKPPIIREEFDLTHLCIIIFISKVCLTLTSKFDLVSGGPDRQDLDRLFIKTKQLIMTVLPCTRENNLIGCLKSKPSPDQIENYWRLVERKEEADKTAENNRTMLEHTNLFQVRKYYKRA